MFISWCFHKIFWDHSFTQCSTKFDLHNSHCTASHIYSHESLWHCCACLYTHTHTHTHTHAHTYTSHTHVHITHTHVHTHTHICTQDRAQQSSTSISWRSRHSRYSVCSSRQRQASTLNPLLALHLLRQITTTHRYYCAGWGWKCACVCEGVCLFGEGNVWACVCVCVCMCMCMCMSMHVCF